MLIAVNSSGARLAEGKPTESHMLGVCVRRCNGVMGSSSVEMGKEETKAAAPDIWFDPHPGSVGPVFPSGTKAQRS